MPTLRFVEISGDDLDADAGFIEVTEDGSVRLTPEHAWMLDPIEEGGLRAPEDITNPTTPSTRPENGFRRVGEEAGGTLLYAPDPADWDGLRWLEALQYHFRTPYFRTLEIEP